MKPVIVLTQKDKYYRQLLEFLRPIKPLSKLNNKDLDVLASMLTKYMSLRNLDHYKRCRYIFSTEVRKITASEAKMSQAAFNNTISKLRRLGIMSSKNQIDKNFAHNFSPSAKIEIIFKWKKKSQESQ